MDEKRNIYTQNYFEKVNTVNQDYRTGDNQEEELAKNIALSNEIPDDKINEVISKLEEILESKKLSENTHDELEKVLEDSKSKKSLSESWKTIRGFLGDTANIIQITAVFPAVYNFLLKIFYNIK